MSRKVSNTGGSAAAAKLGTFASFLVGLNVLVQNAATGVPRLTVTRGNRKISRDAVVWSLLPPDTCPGMGICGLFCYAFKVLKGLNKVVFAALLSNTQAAKRSDFADRMVDRLSKMGNIVAVRVHDAGDVFCQAYILAWTEIARRLPHLHFWMYTKSLWLDFSSLEALPNFTVIKSFGGIRDDLIDKARDNYAVVCEDAKQALAQAQLVGGVACPPEVLGLKLVGANRGWCGLLSARGRCDYCLRKSQQIKVFFVEQDAGWNGFPEDPNTIRRLIGLVEHGLMVPTTATQRRRLEDFKRRYMGGV